MTMKFKPLVIAIAFSAALIGIVSTYAYVRVVKTQRDNARALLVSKELEISGLQKALEVKPKEVFSQVSIPPELKAAVKHKAAIPVAGISVEAKSGTISVPCLTSDRLMPPGTMKDSIPGDTTVPSERPDAQFTPVTIDLVGDLFVAKVRHGPIQWGGSLHGTAHSGDWHENVLFSKDNTKLDVRFNKEINAAIEAYDRSWISKHTALACPGVGIVANPIDGRVHAGLTCTYGLVWF